MMKKKNFGIILLEEKGIRIMAEKEIIISIKNNEDIVVSIPENIDHHIFLDILASTHYYRADITLNVYQAKILAHSILTKVSLIEEHLKKCDFCGREKNCVCPVCEDDS